MSKIAITPNASGTGTINIVAPNTNTDRTLTIPDVAGNFVTTGDSGTVVAGMIGSGAVEYANLDQTLGTWNKLTDVSIATNTAPQLMFHSILNGPYQYYKVIGKIGGTVTVGNTNMQLRWVTGTGTDISGSSYHSGNSG